MKQMDDDPDMLEEYDFSGSVRGKYAKRIALQEELQDFYDLTELREAKQAEGDAPAVRLAEAKRELGLDQRL